MRVFLLDDHEVVRRGLRELLEDARLPDGSGIEVYLYREVRSALPSVACLTLTSYDDDEALFAAIMAGAAGYVLKQIRGTDLVDAVHRVAQGQSLLDPAVTAHVLARLREEPPRPNLRVRRSRNGSGPCWR